MSKQAHTPGPWRAFGGHKSWHVSTESEPKESGAVRIHQRMAVATVAECDPAEMEANARLIAAAPELLEALRILRVQFGDYKDGDGAAKYHACNTADAALALATGDPSHAE